MTNFWEFSVWDTMIGLFILMAFLLIAELLKKKIPFIEKSLLPSSVIAGILLLITKQVWPWFNSLINTEFMSILTYHMLALGFIATTLKSGEKKTKSETKTVLCTGIVTVNGYVIQGIVGLLVTIPLSLIITRLIPGAGLLLPMGFGQGTGQALNWGQIYETTYNFNGGRDFGLSIAALGFIVACIIGVIYLTYLKRKGLITKTTNIKNQQEIVSTKDEEPNIESIDKLTIQLMLVGTVYLITYGLMFGLSQLCSNLGNFGTNTIRPLVWGFNFLFGTIFAVLVKKIINFLYNKKFLKYKPTSNYLLKRLSGMFFDIMIVAGIAAIDVEKLQELWIPLLIMGTLGTIATFIYLKIVSKYLWKGYEYEGILSMFGMLTGTASTGMILLREIDEDYNTPAAENLVYQQVPAIVFALPILLIIPFGAKSLLNAIISLLLLIATFFGYNTIIYLINKKKNEE